MLSFSPCLAAWLQLSMSLRTVYRTERKNGGTILPIANPMADSELEARIPIQVSQ